MAQLAIRSHTTRGKEVIEILEMLGGKNKISTDGTKTFNGTNVYLYYTIEEDNYIHIRLDSRKGDYIKFTLEEFLEKFPYKVGDKVSSKYLKNYKIEKMEWEDTNNRVIYKLQGMGWYSADELQPYKKETMEHFKNNEETKMSIPESMKQIAEAAENLIAPDDVQGSFIMSEEQLKKHERRIIFQNDSPDKTELVLGDEFEIKVDGGKTFVVRKKPQYPKTYEECCKIMKIHSSYELFGQATTQGEITNCVYAQNLLKKINKFQQLIICRDAYWKISDNWKPNWTDYKYCIINLLGNISKCYRTCLNEILSFPNEEMRDAFYENFKDLIEECKELL